MKKLLTVFCLMFLFGCTNEARKDSNSESQEVAFRSLPDPIYYRDCRLEDVCFSLQAQIHEGVSGFSTTNVDCKKVEQFLKPCPQLLDKQRYLELKKRFEGQ